MEIKKFEGIGESVYTETLPNGLRVNVIKKPGYSTFFAAFATDYGGAHRRFSLNGQMHDTPAGVAHFLEHKMFDMPEGDNALNLLSANGADPNAFTGPGMTCYYFECTAGFYENLRMLLKFVSTPYFTEESVQKEQGIIGQEIRMTEDSPAFKLYINLMRLLYAHNPVRDAVAGTAESIAQITAQTLYNCHAAFYAPSNMTLCVTGDVEPEDILDLAGEILPAELSPAPQADFGQAEDETPLSKLDEAFMPVSAPLFAIGAKLTPAEKGRAFLRQKLTGQLALRLLVGRSSAFYNRLYGEGLLNRDFDYELDYCAGTGTVIISGESENPQAVLTALTEAVEYIRLSGLDEAEFERARRASYGARLRGLEDFDNVCVSLAEGVFASYCPLEAFEVLSELKKDECESFITEKLCFDRLAMSVIRPGGGRE